MKSVIYYKIFNNPIFTKNIYIAKFQINDCFENLTHELIVFAPYFDRSTYYLSYIKRFKKKLFTISFIFLKEI